MNKQWYVLQTLTGQEQKVKRYIEAQVHQWTGEGDMAGRIGEVVIPSEKVSEVKGGVKTTVTRKFFPGYVLIHLALYQEDRLLAVDVWHFIKGIQGVIGFVGGDRPAPLGDSEVQDILAQGEARQEKPKPKVTFVPGEIVKIINGPFLNFSGSVDEVDPDRGKLKVSVAIFGRTAPVELEYWQVERA